MRRGICKAAAWLYVQIVCDTSESPEELVETIIGYESIDELVFYTHSVQGNLIIGKKLILFEDFIKKFEGKKVPPVKEAIRFGRLLGWKDPERMITFAKFFKAPR